MAAKVDDSRELTQDLWTWIVLPVERARDVPTGAEVPFHLGTRGFYLICQRDCVSEFVMPQPGAGRAIAKESVVVRRRR
jgi:hypothetical protein